MPTDDIVELTREPLRLEQLIARMENAPTAPIQPGPEAGALVTFSGIVRATEGNRIIPHLEYEHYAGMAERELEDLVGEARSRWPLRRIGLQHRVGIVAVGEPSVLVAVSASHRAEAFEAARFLIDELKRRVPIWKQPPA